MPHNLRQPWVGSAAFAHKGGTHVNAVQKLASSYEHINPELVGNARNVLISDLAGRSNIVMKMKARELGFKLQNDSPELRPILKRIKELENEGYEFEAAEASLALRIQEVVGRRKLPFEVKSYQVTMQRNGNKSVCRAEVSVQAKGKITKARKTGDGPVNALDAALRAVLVKFYPQLKKVALTDYKVRILDSATATAAKTRVLIESSDGRREWGTVGVSENIITASLQALVDSMEYALLKK
jgi:2-isopropylmalate synthase